MRRLVALSVLLGVFAASPVYAQKLPPKQQNKPTEEGRKSKDLAPVAHNVAPPLTSPIAPLGKGDADSDKQTGEQKHPSDWWRPVDLWMTILTACLVLVGLLQLRVFLFQLKVFQRQAGWMQKAATDTLNALYVAHEANQHAERANDLTREALEDARKAAEEEHKRVQRSQRAVVLLDSFDVKYFSEIDAIDVIHTWKNSGPTPTLQMTCGGWYHQSSNINREALYLMSGGRRILGAGMTVEGRGMLLPISAFEQPDGSRHVYFYGWAKYTDVFETEHMTEVCYLISIVTTDDSPLTSDNFHWRQYNDLTNAD